MTTFSRFVPYALGAALITMAVGTAAAEPPDSQESPRPHAVARTQAPPPPVAAPSQPSPSFSSFGPSRAIDRTPDPSPRAVESARPVDRRAPRGFDPGPTPARFAENTSVDDDQARQRVPPSSGGSRAGSGSSGRSGGSSPATGSARPRGGDRNVSSSGRSGGGGSDRDSGYADSRRYPRYVPGDQGRRGGAGYAVRRGTVPYTYYPRYNYYRPYRPSYYYPYYGNWGLGFYFWDPSWYGWGYGGYGYGPYSSPYAYGYGSRYDDTGSVRFRVTPRDAQVYVDGYYVGIVDEFDGTFQRLRLEEGPHRIEVRLDGFDTLRFDVRVLLDGTITLRGDLRPLP